MREINYNDYRASYDELMRTPYVQGSNVLQLEPVRKPKKKKKSHLRVVKTQKPKKDLYTKAQVIQNRMALAITIIALVAVSWSCIHYLQLQADVASRAATINALEKQYVELKTENDLAEVVINSTIDYNMVVDVAMNELGMVYAGKDQVVIYDSQAMECVKQLSNIPAN